MIVLALDPGSVKTGYALLRARPGLLVAGRRRGTAELIEAGLLRAPAKHLPEQRVKTICRELADLIAGACPAWAVIEMTSGKVHRRHHRDGWGGSGQGLAIYGFALGAVWRTCLQFGPGPDRVVLVPENDWTASMPKGRRARFIAAAFPGYDPAADRGEDIADAIGLGLWWIERNRAARQPADGKTATPSRKGATHVGQ